MSRLERLADALAIEMVPFEAALADAAIQAHEKFGRGTGHPADLNFGACFSYALARSGNLPLLFKGEDFVHTDVEPALKPA